MHAFSDISNLVLYMVEGRLRGKRGPAVGKGRNNSRQWKGKYEQRTGIHMYENVIRKPIILYAKYTRVHIHEAKAGRTEWEINNALLQLEMSTLLYQ